METKYKYRVEIQQMMFVSGSSSDPPLPTIMVVEDIVRAQVIELINQGTYLARQRGARFIAVEDIMYLIRHDIAKVNRLSTYLAWKDVRKNARDQDSGGANGVDAPDIMDDPAAALGSGDKKPSKPKRIGLPWKAQNMFAIPMSAVQNFGQGNEDEEDVDNLGDQESDDEDTEAHQLMSDRLRNADLRTQSMTRDEYVHWSECRQASFTFRKGKKFRDWCGISHITDSKLQDDIMDVLGFLTFEIVANITSMALEIKNKSEAKAKVETKDDNRPRVGQLFKLPNMTETPLLPKHIRAAYAKYETPIKKATALKTWRGGMLRYQVRIV